MILNLGCGFNKLEGAVNIDYDSRCKPDLILDLEKQKLPFEDNSVDKIFAIHVLDRMSYGFFYSIKEIYRVCKSGAMVHINVTHPKSDAFLQDLSICRAITIEGMWLLSKKNNGTSAKVGNRNSNLAYIHDVDFEVVDVSHSNDDTHINLVVVKL